MFWGSIIEGLAILGHWEIWLATVIYMGINFAFLIVVTKTAGEDEFGEPRLGGCLFYMIGAPLLHAMLMSLMIAFLLPILLGGSSVTSFSTVIGLIGPIIKSGIVAMVAVIIFSFIPLFGAFIAKSPGIQSFLIGVIIFRLLSDYAIDQVINEANMQGNVYPGFWSSLGFLIIAGVLVRLVMFLLVLISTPFEETMFGELIPTVIGPVFGLLGGIIPLFMYSSYVRLSIIELQFRSILY